MDRELSAFTPLFQPQHYIPSRLDTDLSYIMKAVIIKEHGIAALEDIKEQAMHPDYFKVKTVAVAINPTDIHHAASVGRVGGILGCDLSGIVEDIGENCKSDVKKGDHVYGVCHGGNLVSPCCCFCLQSSPN
jgi:NADPH:quinone reductase-like Zn-dependent oxidoreductase